MKIAGFVLIFTLLTVTLFAQVQRGRCPGTNSRQARNLYFDAITALQNEKEREAYDLLNQAAEIDPDYVDVWYALADIYHHRAKKNIADTSVNSAYVENYSKAVDYYSKVIELCGSFDNYKAYFYVGEFYYELRDYYKATDYLEEYLKHNKASGLLSSKANKYLNNAQTYKRLISNPIPFTPSLLNNVCTTSDEYLPIFSPDGEYLFYTHRYKKKLNNYDTRQEVEEFTMSKRLTPVGQEPEVFSPGEAMPFPFNTENRNQGGASITIDNKQIYITICEVIRAQFTSYRNCDIYMSSFKDNGWTTLKNLGPNINNVDTWEGQPSITSDGKTLYYASTRDGGNGGIDIYRSEKNDKGEWGKAVNLGEMINTDRDDKTPFIHSDGRTLYFASNGHFGLGGFDIFYSTLEDTGWTEPMNLGYPLNTRNDEVGYIVSANGNKIYFASNTLGGKGGYDIYSAILPREARPNRVVFVKGQLSDTKGENITDGEVELTSVVTNEITDGLVDEKTGKYAVAVKVDPNEDFIMTARKLGYFYYTRYIDSESELFDPPTTINIEIEPITPSIPIILKNVIFEFNSSVLDSIDRIEIDQLLAFLQDNPNLVIELRGHTDDVGNRERNMSLSLERAAAVRNYLIDKGIDTNRIFFHGYGETMPISNNYTEDGRALNRRVEFVIIKK